MTLAALGTTDLQDCSLQSSRVAIYMFCQVAFFYTVLEKIVLLNSLLYIW